MKIDLVYLWVNGNDKKWQQERKKWLRKCTNISKYASCKARWRNNDELKYSLRSVEKNLSWINHIFIITGFNQIPKWLNTNNPKITIVPHSDIMSCDALPTFNSAAIATCIGKIKQLNEHFLIFNDDIFVNKPIPKSFFFTKQGHPIYRYKSRKHITNIGKMLDNKNEYETILLITQQLVKNLYNKNVYKYSPAHCIEAHLKSTWEQCWTHPILQEKLQVQERTKFRNRTGTQPQIFSLINIVYKKCKTLRVRDYKQTSNPLWNFVYNTILHWKSVHYCPFYCSDATKIAEIKYNPYDICVNDEPQIPESVCKQNKRILEKMFPEKSMFEK